MISSHIDILSGPLIAKIKFSTLIASLYSKSLDLYYQSNLINHLFNVPRALLIAMTYVGG